MVGFCWILISFWLICFGVGFWLVCVGFGFVVWLIYGGGFWFCCVFCFVCVCFMLVFSVVGGVLVVQTWNMLEQMQTNPRKYQETGLPRT